MEVVPSYHGYIETNADALLLAQAVLDGKLNPVSRRPYEIERPQLIVSGNVFVFIEEKSGIKRWTDGVSWSPSRIMGKFLVYRELDKQNSGSIGGNGNTPQHGYGGIVAGRGGGREDSMDVSDEQGAGGGAAGSSMVSKALVGSLNNSYAFKPGGLVKKTMSLKLKRASRVETVHIISYYTADDVEAGKLVKPSNSPFFSQVRSCRELISALDSSSVGNSRSASGQGAGTGGGSSNAAAAVPGGYLAAAGPAMALSQPAYQSLAQLPSAHHRHHHRQQQPAPQPQPQYYGSSYYSALQQNSPKAAPLHHNYSYYTQPNHNMHLYQQQQPQRQQSQQHHDQSHQEQEQQHQEDEQQQQRRAASSSTSTTVDMSQMTAASVGTAATTAASVSQQQQQQQQQQPHGQFLPHPGTLFPPDQQKPSGIQLPLPFPHGAAPQAQAAAPPIQQPQLQQHSTIPSASSCTSYISYPAYNMQQYVQSPPMYTVSRYGVGGTPQLPFNSQVVPTSPPKINIIPQHMYNYEAQQEQQFQTGAPFSTANNANIGGGGGGSNPTGLIDDKR
ncbi:Mit1p Ecym_4496 [Eremothecium cymbalariae DBVPG|uniref:Uncharacterized protein n=1 Tax=Eremothecium cymbalariae (strain CBS 270.75 / DBVPG 7215 / KCTC 17166 / NRRL Y-17582) TaxID=931890 RepID=G8JU32_ERECY|nr:hypothetical protein Ecym_4496 [Eremothecium cymbalariae DBVPG\